MPARPDRNRWLLVSSALLVFVALHLAGPAATEALRYERDGVLAGEAWRLLTGHLVHFDRAHLAWNVAGLVLVAVLFAREYTAPGWLLVCLSSTFAIDLGFLALEPELRWYVGFSGVLHGCMAAGLVAWLRSRRDALTLLVAGLFAAKLAWEHAMGPLPFTAGSLSLPVIHEAHTYGAIGGAVAALLLTGRQRAAEAPL